MRKLMKWKMLFSNIKRCVKRAILLPQYMVGFFVLLVVRLLSPVICLKFHAPYRQRIGHLSREFDLYLSDKKPTNNKKIPVVVEIFAIPRRHSANLQLRKMLNRKICIMPFANILVDLNKWLPGENRHIIDWTYYAECADFKKSEKNPTPVIELTKAENEKGQRNRLEFGISENMPHVCFFARDSSYMERVYGGEKSGIWSYHDYRDSDIDNYMPAIESITVNNELAALRMGKIVEKEIRSNNKLVIDYASSKDKCDFMDMYLLSTCLFCVAAVTGLSNVATMLRRPIVFVNAVPILTLYHGRYGYGCVYIPKKLWLKKEKRYMSLQETLEQKADNLCLAKDYETKGIQLIENTAEEIKEVVLEMYDRVKGKWQETKEERNLQEKFWKFIGADTGDMCWAKMGAKFLRDNYGEELRKINE